MRRLQLTEFDTKTNVQLSINEMDGLRELYPGIGVEPSLHFQDRYDLTPDQKIGVVCLPTLVVEIRPKIPISSVLFLISYCCQGVNWRDECAELAGDVELVEALAIMLARMVQQATRRGLLNGYRSEDESLLSPRGRFLFDEQIRRRATILPPIEVRHDVFTADILENRLLLSALRAMERMPHRWNGTKPQLARAQRLFGGVENVQFRPAFVPDVVFTRLNHHYHPSLTLARLLIRSQSLDLGTEGAMGCAFLIDMNEVFEDFIRIALREKLRKDFVSFPDQLSHLFLDEKKVVPLRPDLCLLDSGRAVWVGDAKYKRLPTGGYLNADLYQLLAYTVALGLPGGELIYAGDAAWGPVEHLVTHAAKRLSVVALDLRAPPKMILSQIQQIADRIQSQVHHESAQSG